MLGGPSNLLLLGFCCISSLLQATSNRVNYASFKEEASTIARDDGATLSSSSEAVISDEELEARPRQGRIHVYRIEEATNGQAEAIPTDSDDHMEAEGEDLRARIDLHIDGFKRRMLINIIGVEERVQTLKATCARMTQHMEVTQHDV
ncbi:hypothetical protein NE237_021482 [Protea cynaroides]|uniref:Uncharacterized protein n=1 Tax=Protea cynaroides TaxID=273540 RepID=A0A9Q0HCG5_9MAGN|nr:hypothetical protein NE237_021482 [Protea cynaroides]